MEKEFEHGKTREIARVLALVEMERRYYQEIVASLPAGLLILSSGLNVVSSNREVRRIFGLRSGEPMPARADQFFPPTVLEQINQVLAGGEPQKDLRVPVPGDPGRDLRIGISQIRKWDDEPGREVLLTIQDCDPAADASAAEQETPPLAGMLDSLDAVIWAVEISSKRFLYVNEKAQELLGFAVGKWLNTETFWSDRIHPADRDWMLAAYERSIATWSRHACEYRAVTSYGRVVWLRENARILQDTEGNARHLIGFAVDITDRRLLDQQYVQAQRLEAVSRLAARMSNEITNHAMVISGYANEVIDALPAAHPLRADLREILAATDRLHALTGHLSLPGRAAGAATEAVDAGELLNDLKPSIQETLGGVKLELKLFPASVGVLADPVQLKQIVMLFVRRAVRGLAAGDQLTIDCSPTEIDEAARRPASSLQAGVYAVIVIEDPGPAMDAETRAALFESLLPSKETGEDLGPALARAYALVRQWGGDISVSSDPTQGNSIQIFLPRPHDGPSPQPPISEPAEGNPPPESPAAGEPADEPLRSILIVESDPGIRSLLHKVLARQRYEILEADQIDEALTMAAGLAAPLHLVIADALLPTATSREVLSAFRRSSPDLKVLYLDGGAESELSVPPDFPAGTSVLHKPFTLTALLDKVRDLLAKTI